jgi:AcrR family transcriptional regulator
MDLAITDDTVPLTRRGESTRERIIQSAAWVLADKGYSGTTLADIAGRANTKAGSLYYYFESREVLIREIMTRGITETQTYVKAAVAALTPEASSRDRLAAAITAHVRYMLTENDISRASIRTLGQAPAEVQGPAIELHREYGQYLAELIDDVRTDGYLLPQTDSRVLRLLMVGAANWTSAWYDPSGSASVEQIAETLVQMALGELAGPGPDGPE